MRQYAHSITSSLFPSLARNSSSITVKRKATAILSATGVVLATRCRCRILPTFSKSSITSTRKFSTSLVAAHMVTAVAPGEDHVSQKPLAELEAVASLEAVVSKEDADAKERVVNFVRVKFGGKVPLIVNKTAIPVSNSTLMPTPTTRSFWSTMCGEGLVLVNGEATERTRILKEGDVIRFLPPLSVLDKKAGLEGIEIKYEDEHVAVIWKCAGVSFCYVEDALPQMLQHSGSTWIPKCLIRLEKAFSGLTVCAKTRQAYDELWRLALDSRIGTRWRAICHGRGGNAGDVIERTVVKGCGSAISAKVSIVSVAPSNLAGSLSDVEIEYYLPPPRRTANSPHQLSPHLEVPLFVPDNPFVAGKNFSFLRF